LLVGSPFPHYSRKEFIQKLSTVLAEVCDEVQVLGANKPAQYPNIEWDEYIIKNEVPPISRHLSFFKYQLVSVLQSSSFDHVIIRDPTSILSIPSFRLTNIPHSMFLAQKTERKLINFTSKINTFISKEILVESSGVLSQWGISDSTKTRIGATYVDTEKYHPTTDFLERTKTLGYLGILEQRKGIKPLMESISTITKRNPRISIRIAGDGSMRERVERSQDQLENLEYYGYIPESDVVDFYNNLSLLILPTKSEGLPNVALEAMACGTPVLATTVGGLPDLINDGENGFLMEDNRPSTIDVNISRALDSDLQAVSERARDTVVKKYTFEDAVRRYEKIVT